MQAFRLSSCAAFRSTARPAWRTLQPLLQSTQQARFASRYPRIGEKASSGQSWSNFGPAYRAQFIWRNYRTPVLVVSGGGVAFYVANQEQVPITGRRRFNVISPENEKQIAAGEYQNILSQFKGRIFPPEHPYTQAVAKVVERLLPHSGLSNEEWRVHVIDAPGEMNAFVIPGGKVFVLSGMLNVCKDENGLAAVLGHEIAHNVAHHTSEKISQGFVTMLFAFAASFLLDVSGGLGQDIASLFLTMPNSRTMEQEADHIGLLMMAESCYDPKSAVDLWTRMQEVEKAAGQSVPQFMSTHPTSYNRRELIRGWLPQAEAKFQESGCSATQAYMQDFNKAAGSPKSSQIGRGRRMPEQQAGSRGGGDDDYFF